MISRIFFAFTFVTTILLGYGFGSGFLPRKSISGAKVISGIHPEKEFQAVEFKSFAIVLYAYNDADWCERSLRSIFEQDYEAFRLIFVDDGSTDNTFERVQNFIVENQQEHRAILIRNESTIGTLPSLYRAVQHCLDKELILPVSAKDWLAGPSALLSWNRAFQNPDAWIAFGRTIRYPSYEFLDPPNWTSSSIKKRGYRDFNEGSSHCFYSALFKQLSVRHLFGSSSGYFLPLLELSGGRIKNVWEPVSFLNETLPVRKQEEKSIVAQLEPLAHFPKSNSSEKKEADVVLFSLNRPMHLYAALESLQRNITGYRDVIALFWPDPSTAYAYEQLQATFPQVQFLPQGKDFKRSLYKTIFESTAEYLLLSSDENLVKDPIDLRLCTQMLRKTGADGFLLQLNHLANAVPVSGDVFASHFEAMGLKIDLEMGLYHKESLKVFFKSVRYENYQDIRSAWKAKSAKDSIYLSFSNPKAIEIPTLFSNDELVSKFNQGYKIDLDPLYRGENPEFIPR